MAIITHQDLKNHLAANGVTTQMHDINIATAVAGANSAVNLWCGRAFDKTAVAAETARLYGCTRSGLGIRHRTLAVVDDFWDTTNLVVKTDDNDDGTFETTWAASDYQFEPLSGVVGGVTGWPYYVIRAVEGRGFPSGRRAGLQVTAAWGWTAVPGDVFQATLIKAARLFHRTMSPQGVAGFGDFGVVRISSREDPDCVLLLSQYRRSETAAMVA